MSSGDVPEPWATRMIEKGFTDPRYLADVPSLSQLSVATGVHTSTVSSVVKGGARRPSAETIAALTRALGDDVADWLGVPRPAAWSPPAESSLLTDRQRKAVEEIIRAMTEHREDVKDDGRPAPITRAGESPATVTPLRPDEVTPEEDLPIAAHPVKGRDSEGRRRRRALDEVGEESQDPGANQ